ncbi:MAG TPA: ABC transporter substrate-binding protein [Alphaproteobacteria bacterium]|nr:ABC transporter substrate-binding protein [Alphaproteobacteria bacterium]
MIGSKLGKLGIAAALLAGAAFLSAPASAAPFKIIVTHLEPPLVPNSVIDMALELGYYKKEGVDVEIVRVQQTPSAVAALRSGQGDMANIGFDVAVQLVAREQMNIKGVVSPDKALPFIIAAKKSITSPKQLEGKTFGVSRVGAVDYSLTRTVLSSLGVDVSKIDYLAVGQPPVRATSLAAGKVDATTISIGVWTSLPDKSALGILVTQADYYKGAPLISKLNVVSADTAKNKAKEVEAVVRATMKASRDFAKNPKLWVDAMAKALPNTDRAALEFLGDAYKENWDVNGGLNLAEAKATTDDLYANNDDFKGLKRVEPAAWIDTSFIDNVIKSEGAYPGIDPTGR